MEAALPVSEELTNGEACSEWRRLDLQPQAEGTTASVWRARHRDRGSLAALKIAKPIAGAAEVLAREARLLHRLGRRWGPALLDAGPGFLATEWVEGVPLDRAS